MSTTTLNLTHNELNLSESKSLLPKGRDLTPLLGTELESGFQASNLLDGSQESKARGKELARLISTRGVVFLRDQQDLSPSSLCSLATLLHESSGVAPESGLHIHPLEESVFGEMGELKSPANISSITNLDDEKRRLSQMENEKSTLASYGWHTDISFEPVPADYTLLHMHTIPPKSGGDTLFSSSYAAYDRLSPKLKKLLDGTHAVHDAATFREQADRFGFELFEGPRGNKLNVGRDVRTIHPVVRTHPITGWKSLFVNKAFTTRIEELNPDESELILNYLFTLNKDNHDLQCRFKWTKSSLAIWDNRAVQHSATFDYGKTPRAGDRVVSLGEKPYFDARSKSQAEALGL